MTGLHGRKYISFRFSIRSDLGFSWTRENYMILYDDRPMNSCNILTRVLNMPWRSVIPLFTYLIRFQFYPRLTWCKLSNLSHPRDRSYVKERKAHLGMLSADRKCLPPYCGAFHLGLQHNKLSDKQISLITRRHPTLTMSSLNGLGKLDS